MLILMAHEDGQSKVKKPATFFKKNFKIQTRDYEMNTDSGFW